MFHAILFLLLGATQYGNQQAHEDSMFIYNAYTESAKVFEEATEPKQWKKVDDSVAQVTALAFARLHKYNKEKYASSDELNRETIGVALVFPQPSTILVAETKPNTEVKAGATDPTKEIAFKVLDEQTHFLLGANGKGRVPYVVMNYYAKGHILVKSEKLDPITLKPIETEASGPATSSN